VLGLNPRIKNYLYFTIFITFLVLAYQLYTDLSADYKNPDSQLQDKVNLPPNESTDLAAPDFTIFDQQGREVKLSDFRGQPVVLNFWASWCPPCRKEMPHFNEVYQESREQVVFLMVDLIDGTRETESKGKAFVREQNFSFPIYFDSQLSAAQAFGVGPIPITFLINAEGNVVQVYQGAIDKDALYSGIRLITK